MAFPLSRQRLVAIAMLLGLPLLTWYIWICLTFFGGALVLPASIEDLVRLLRYIPAPTPAAILLYAAWLVLQIVLHIALPARERQGTPLAGGPPLTYRLNGWASFWATWLIVVAAWLTGLPAGIAYDQFGPLLTTATIVAFTLALYVYVRGRSSAGRAGDAIHAYVMGVSLNPRVRSFDLKFFCESRPALMLWVVINASLAARQYELLGRVTPPMLLVNAFQFLYVADYFFHEEAILTTWDIKHERFGWMLCWGCLVWVPFTFTIQAYYLVTHTHDLSAAAAAGIVALNLAGYAIFRGVNLQKHRFRLDPSRAVWGRPPEYIRTAAGPLLLTSGWWGLARHLNYLGDLLMGLAWCLPTGFEHPLPYFYIGYFVILLIHRERRDHAMCLQKYGRDWEAYCRKVRWRIVPGLY
jgi:Delta14-sterol reductase